MIYRRVAEGGWRENTHALGYPETSMTKAGIMEIAELYLELSDYYDHRGKAQSRDRFLVLAADAARKAGDPEEAEHLRQRLLALDPHHLLKPFASFDDALKSDVSDYINALRRRHPAEQVAALVESTVRPSANRAGAPEPTQHLQMPPPQPVRIEPVRAEPPPPRRPVEVYRMRLQRSRPRPASDHDRHRRLLRCRLNRRTLGGSDRSRASKTRRPFCRRCHFKWSPRPPAPSVSPFRPQHPQMSQPAVPVYQGLRMATTPGSWLCTILFLGLLIGGIGIAIYSLGRVFLPAEFIPAKFLPSRD